MPKIEPFEKYSDAYEEWFEKHHNQYASELAAIRTMLPPPGSLGVEVGVGTGRFAAPLEIKIGIEPSSEMAKVARERGIQVISGVAEDLPFLASRFDFLLMVTTICFVDDIIRSFAEAFRVLNPGGSILVGFVDKESELGRQYLNRRDRSRFYQDATFFSAHEVQAALQKVGFEIKILKQTLIPGASTDTILDGVGKGAFVAIQALKSV